MNVYKIKTPVKALFFFLHLCSVTLFAQNKSTELSTSIEFTPFQEKAIIRIHSDTDSILNISVNLIDPQNKIIKNQKLPNEFRYIKSYFDLLGILPGKYTLVILKDSVQIESKEFTKDEILAEPQKQPVIRRSN